MLELAHVDERGRKQSFPFVGSPQMSTGLLSRKRLFSSDNAAGRTDKKKLAMVRQVVSNGSCDHKHSSLSSEVDSVVSPVIRKQRIGHLKAITTNESSPCAKQTVVELSTYAGSAGNASKQEEECLWVC